MIWKGEQVFKKSTHLEDLKDFLLSFISDDMILCLCDAISYWVSFSLLQAKQLNHTIHSGLIERWTLWQRQWYMFLITNTGNVKRNKTGQCVPTFFERIGWPNSALYVFPLRICIEKTTYCKLALHENARVWIFFDLRWLTIVIWSLLLFYCTRRLIWIKNLAIMHPQGYVTTYSWFVILQLSIYYCWYTNMELLHCFTTVVDLVLQLWIAEVPTFFKFWQRMKYLQTIIAYPIMHNASN